MSPFSIQALKTSFFAISIIVVNGFASAMAGDSLKYSYETAKYTLPKTAQENLTTEIKSCENRVTCLNAIARQSVENSKNAYFGAISQIHPLLRDLIGEACAGTEKTLDSRTLCYAQELDRVYKSAETFFDSLQENTTAQVLNHLKQNRHFLDSFLSVFCNQTDSEAIEVCIDQRFTIAVEQVRNARDTMLVAYYELAKWGTAVANVNSNIKAAGENSHAPWSAKDFVVDQDSSPYIWPFRISAKTDDAGVEEQDNCSQKFLSQSRIQAFGNNSLDRVTGQARLFLCDVRQKAEDPAIPTTVKSTLLVLSKIVTEITELLISREQEIGALYSKADAILIALAGVAEYDSNASELVKVLKDIRNTDPMSAYRLIMMRQNVNSPLRQSYCKWRTSLDQQVPGALQMFPRELLFCLQL